MREIMLQPVPNQRIDVSVGGMAWRIDIKAVTGGMSASIWADNELLISGTRFNPRACVRRDRITITC